MIANKKVIDMVHSQEGELIFSDLLLFIENIFIHDRT